MLTVSSAGASPPPKFSNEKPSRLGVYRSDAPTAVASGVVSATIVVVGATAVVVGATSVVVETGGPVIVVGTLVVEVL